MILAAVVLGIVQVLCTISVCIFLRHFFQAKQAELEQRAEEMLHLWVDAPAPDKPSKLAEVVGAVGEVVGRTAAQSIMASLSAGQSHVARAANSMADEVQGAQNPILGLLTGGKRGKGAAIAKLAQVLGPAIFGGAAGAGAGTGDNGQPRSSVMDRLKRQN